MHCGNEIHVSIFKYDRDIDVIEMQHVSGLQLPSYQRRLRPTRVASS